jgi:hypothetical protein
MKRIVRLVQLVVALLCLLNIQQAMAQPAPAAPIRIVKVATAAGLQQALDRARPGDAIELADGVYEGRFVISEAMNGTAEHPVLLRGSRKAILDGGAITTGYVLHIQASYWIIKGITLRNGLKGIMADGIHYTTIDSVLVTGIGEEGIHLRKFSTYNSIQRAEITHTGLKTPDYGEGIYIGSAKNNWAKHAGGLPDRCDSNSVLHCIIGPAVAAECIDVKEGTTGGIIRFNVFDAAGITGANSADSWMDVKGNAWIIADNKGLNTAGSLLQDGYQVHCAVDGWGCYNVFANNTCIVNAPGFAINISLSSSNGKAVGNKVYRNNNVEGATKGLTNVEPE